MPLQQRVWRCLPEVQAVVINIQHQVLAGRTMVNTVWLCLLSLGDAFSSCFSCCQNALWAVPDCHASSLLSTFASSPLCQVLDASLLPICGHHGAVLPQGCHRHLSWSRVSVSGLGMQGTCGERTSPQGS